jgi:hypothetical protein
MPDVDSSLESLRAWCFARLLADLKAKQPGFVEAFNAQYDPEGEPDLPAIRAQMNFPPCQPWSDVLGAILSIELGLMELDFALLSLAKAPDGLAVWFHYRQIPFQASSCFERLEYLVKRLSRAKLLIQ